MKFKIIVETKDNEEFMEGLTLLGNTYECIAKDWRSVIKYLESLFVEKSITSISIISY